MGVYVIWTLDGMAFWIWGFNWYFGVGNIGTWRRDLARLVIIPPTINFNHPRLLLYKFLSVIHHDSHINGVFWKSGGFIHINDKLERVEYKYIYAFPP